LIYTRSNAPGQSLFFKIGAHEPEQVVVLDDSGYDNRKIQKAIIKKMAFYHGLE
jgi:hypothetical protein